MILLLFKRHLTKESCHLYHRLRNLLYGAKNLPAIQQALGKIQYYARTVCCAQQTFRGRRHFAKKTGS